MISYQLTKEMPIEMRGELSSLSHFAPWLSGKLLRLSLSANLISTLSIFDLSEMRKSAKEHFIE